MQAESQGSSGRVTELGGLPFADRRGRGLSGAGGSPGLGLAPGTWTQPSPPVGQGQRPGPEKAGCHLSGSQLVGPWGAGGVFGKTCARRGLSAAEGGRSDFARPGQSAVVLPHGAREGAPPPPGEDRA